MLDLIFIYLVAIALMLGGFYLIIKAALKETILKEAQRTNTLLLELLKANGVDTKDIATKEEKIQRLVEQQIKLTSRFERKELDKEQYSDEYTRLEDEKRWAK